MSVNGIIDGGTNSRVTQALFWGCSVDVPLLPNGWTRQRDGRQHGMGWLVMLCTSRAAHLLAWC